MTRPSHAMCCFTKDKKPCRFTRGKLKCYHDHGGDPQHIITVTLLSSKAQTKGINQVSKKWSTKLTGCRGSASIGNRPLTMSDCLAWTLIEDNKKNINFNIKRMVQSKGP